MFNELGPRHRYRANLLGKQRVRYPNKRVYLTNQPGDLITINHLLALSRKLVAEEVIFKQQVSALQI